MPSQSDGNNPSGDTNAGNTAGAAATTTNNNNATQQQQRRRNRTNRPRRPATPSFVGSDSTMNGHIFDVPTDRVSDQYIQTVKEIVKWVGRKYDDYPGTFMDAVENVTVPTVGTLGAPTAQGMVAEAIWKEDLKEHRKATRAYAVFLSNLYSLIMGQCTPALEDRIRAHADFAAAANNGILLLQIVRQITHTFEEERHLGDAMMSVKEKFYAMKQYENQSLQSYYEHFLSQVDILEAVEANIVDTAVLNEVASNNGRPGAPNLVDRGQAKQRTLAIRFLRGLNTKHAAYVRHLRNDYVDGNDHYPTTLTAAYNRVHQRLEEHTEQRRVGDGVAFVISGHGPNPPDDGRGNGATRSASGFMFTQGKSNIPPNWILLDSQSTVNLFCNPDLLTNICETDLEMNIRCNAGSRTTNRVGELPGFGTVWFDPDGLANILSLKSVQEKYHVSYNSDDGNKFVVTKPDGKQMTFYQSNEGLYYLDIEQATQTAESNDNEDDLKGYSFLNTVDYNKTKYSVSDYKAAKLAREIQIKIGRPTSASLIHIIHHKLLPNCPITKDDVIAADDIFGTDIGSLKGKTTRRRPHKVVQNTESLSGDTLARHRQVTICADVMFINGNPMLVTVSRNICFGTVEGLSNQSARSLGDGIIKVAEIYKQKGFQVILALMDGQFESIRHRLAAAGIQLNTTGRDEHVGEIERYIRTIKERVRGIVNTLPFNHMPSRMIVEMAKSAVFWLNSFPPKNGISQNMSPRAIITGVSIDYKLHCRHEFGEYVQTHEQHSNDMKTQTVGALAMRPTGNLQGTWHYLSLGTGRLIKRNRATVLPMPREVIDRIEQLAEKDSSQSGLHFGDRDNNDDDTWDDADIDDESTESPDPNEQYHQSLFPRQQDDTFDGYDEFSVDLDDGTYYDSTSYQDEDDGSYQEDTSYNDEDNIDDDDDDLSYDESVYRDEMNEDQSPIKDDALEDDALVVPEREPPVTPHTGMTEHALRLSEVDNNDVEEEIVFDNAGSTGVPMENTGVMGQDEANMEQEGISENEEGRNTGVDGHDGASATRASTRTSLDEIRTVLEQMQEDDAAQAELDKEMTRKYGRRTNKHKLRKRRKPRQPMDYSDLGVLIGNILLTVAEVTESNEETFATRQMSMKKGLKVFKEKGHAAVGKEVNQLHVRKVMQAKIRNELTPEQRKEALGYLMYLKRKRCGKVKARGCADGRKQRAYIDKADAASPTVSNEAVFLTAVIDALEGREVAILDIPGAFMQADMPEGELVHVRLTGVMVDKLLEIDEEMYLPYVTYEKGEKVLYVELLKALYGTLRAARLFWEKLSGKLTEWGFMTNPYDHCVANKMINGKMLTVVWHVDDLKISHVEKSVVDKFIKDVEKEFGKEAPLNVSRGKVHDYLGMKLDYSSKGEVKVTMIDYIKSIINDMPKEMIGKATSPAANHLFNVNEVDPVLLVGDKRDTFVHIVMQLLYLSQRARPDIRTAVSFLCTRLTKADEDDYKKLSRVMKYLQSTTDLPLVLAADGSGQVKWWVDAAFAVHPDMKGHTGGTMSLGQGSVYSTSTRQKLVTRSSTEAEVVGVHDVLPQMLWTGYFLKEQGVSVNDTILYQDNISSMYLEKNGRASSGKRTRHMNIRYFFIKNRVDAKEIRIEHCPTDVMIADFFTKPLQGKQFRLHRDAIMNIDPTSEYSLNRRSVLNNDNNDEVEDRTQEEGNVESTGLDSKTYRDAVVFGESEESKRSKKIQGSSNNEKRNAAKAHSFRFAKVTK